MFEECHIVAKPRQESYNPRRWKSATQEITWDSRTIMSEIVK